MWIFYSGLSGEPHLNILGKPYKAGWFIHPDVRGK